MASCSKIFNQYSARILWVMIWGFTAGCSPVETTAIAPTDSAKSEIRSGDGAAKVLPAITVTDSTLTLPTWCKMNPASDQVCFHCSRTDDGVPLEYEQCLTPSDSFRASTDCWFSNQVTKTISCLGTRSGETFTMDVSTAKEKVTVTIPVFLIALNLAVSEKYGPTSSVTKFVTDISTFLGSRMEQIMRREDLSGVAGDLAMLVNNKTTSKLNDQQLLVFKVSAYAAFEAMLLELSGKKDYDVSKVLLRGLRLSGFVPANLMGEAKPLLSGSGLASLWLDSKSQSLETMFKILGPSVVGVSSAELLLQRLQQDN